MKKIVIIATLVTVLLVSMIPIMILPKPVEAWNGSTHGSLLDSVETILRFSAKQGFSDKEQLEYVADEVHENLHWLERGAEDADLMAFDANGNPKQYHFYVHCPGDGDPVDTWVDSTWKIGSGLPGWLYGLKVLEWADTCYATMDQFQEGFSTYTLPIFCTNLRTAGQTADDYFNLAKNCLDNIGPNPSICGATTYEQEAMWWLGMACHMLQDCCIWFHASTNIGYLYDTCAVYYVECEYAQQSWDKDWQLDDDSLTTLHSQSAWQDFFVYDRDPPWDPFTFVAECSEWTQQSITDVMESAYAAELRTAQFIYNFFYPGGGLPHGYDCWIRFENPPTVFPNYVVGDNPTTIVSGQTLYIRWNQGTQMTELTKLYIADLKPLKSGYDSNPFGWTFSDKEYPSKPYFVDPPDWEQQGYPYNPDMRYDQNTAWIAPPVTEPMVTLFELDNPSGGNPAPEFSDVVIIYPPSWRARVDPIIYTSVDLFSPKPMQVLQSNTICPIRWEAKVNYGLTQSVISNLGIYVEIYYVTTNSQGKTSTEPIAVGLPNTGLFNWQIPPELYGHNCKLRIIAYDSSGRMAEDSVDITIQGVGNLTPYTLPPSITVVSPSGNKTFTGMQEIKWNASTQEPLLFDVSLESETQQFLLAQAYAQSSPIGEYSLWVDLSSFPCGNYKVRVDATEYVTNKTGARSAEDVSDDYFRIGTTASIDPTEISGQSPSVNIIASSVVGFSAWEANLTFDPTVLQCTSVEEGPFLATEGPVFWAEKDIDIDNTKGLIKFVATVYGNATGVNGTGVLATANFKTLRLGNSSISLENVKFHDYLGQPIPVDIVIHGYYAPTHDVMVKYVTLPYREVYPGCNIKVMISNVGNYNETVEVTAYLNDTIIGAHTTPLPPETDVPLDYYIPPKPDLGDLKLYVNYTLRVEVSPVPGEAILGDNLYIYGHILIKGGCFIATAAYGTPMAKEIGVLRDFRDRYLLTNPVGEALVELYYKVSPPMAEFITEHPSLKPIVRVGLLPAVAMSAIAVNTTPVEKMAILGLLTLVSVVAVAILVTRRRGRGPEHT